MADSTTRLDLNTFDGSDPFSEDPFNENWSKLDSAPGVHICESTNRPVWGTPQIGRLIFETNTKRLYEYIGSSNYSLIADGAMPTPQTDYSDENVAISNISTLAAPTILDSSTHVFKTFTRPMYCLISWQIAVQQSAAAGQQNDIGCFGWAYRTGNTIDTGTLSALQGRLQISKIEHTGTSGAIVSLSGSEIFLAGTGATVASPKGHTFYCAGYKSGPNWDGGTTAQRITVTPIR